VGQARHVGCEPTGREKVDTHMQHEVLEWAGPGDAESNQAGGCMGCVRGGRSGGTRTALDLQTETSERCQASGMRTTATV
jgi:hypothetical protein